MPSHPPKPPAAAPFDAVLKAQAEGLGLIAWVGATMLDHAARTATELAAFTRDEARRDALTLGALATCRDPGRAAALRGAYLGDKLAACTDEAEKLARMTAEVCELTRMRMTGTRG
ncbi:hypothetical protein [Rhodovulum strictum]|uniref:Phasin protein n=1 Tax=Rhodovulum strictum TaxID=58314 RepID=A0A844BHW2_9RHOB|nr:hypothetical protein [Rhodovulum strictum]MRH19577.1 hypothetical protein [Rhodovulum strictum]